MTLREQLDARLAEFDLRSADAQTRTDAVIEGWKLMETAGPVRPVSRLRSFFRRGDDCGQGD